MRTVLIIDDEPVAGRHLARALQDKGFKTNSVLTGEEGTEAYRLQKYDFVLLDLFLPKKNGLDILAEIKELDKAARVLMITGETRADIFQKAKDGGAAGYVMKPLSVERLSYLADCLAGWEEKDDENFFIIGGKPTED